MTEKKTCHSKECNDPPAVRVFWPGETPPPEFCFGCALTVMRTAVAMGFHVHTEPLPLFEPEGQEG